MPIYRLLSPVGGGFIRPVFFYSNFKSGLDESSPYPGHDASCPYLDRRACPRENGERLSYRGQTQGLPLHITKQILFFKDLNYWCYHLVSSIIFFPRRGTMNCALFYNSLSYLVNRFKI